MLNFESSTGSSWLIEELSAHPQICVVLFEPIDNISLASARDHNARLHWLRILWTPPVATAGPAEWRSWRARLEAASVFGQLRLVRESVRRCSPRSVAFGLKARLSRLLTRDASMAALRELMGQRGAHLIRLSRRNRVKQALAEYRRLYAGLGQFRAAANATASVVAAHVDLPLFRRSLHAVERSHRLAERVVGRLAAVARLDLTYEALKDEHEATVGRVADFLRVPPRVRPPDGAGRGYAKATPDRLCAAVGNYAELCEALASEAAFAPFLDGPCDAPCVGAPPAARLRRPG